MNTRLNCYGYIANRTGVTIDAYSWHKLVIPVFLFLGRRCAFQLALRGAKTLLNVVLCRLPTWLAKLTFVSSVPSDHAMLRGLMAESSRYFERFISTAVMPGFIVMLCFLLAGCGGSSTPVPPIPISAMNGNFSITATSSGSSGANIFNGAVQTDSAGHVSGIVHVQGPFLFCFGVPFELPLTGTIDSAGRLNATITGSGNQTITLNANVSPNGALLSDGSYSGSGAGCVGGDQGAIAGFQVQPFTGTYSGSFSPSPSTNITLDLALTQSAAANSHGVFPVSASTITVTGGAACGFASATLVPQGGAASGDDLQLDLLGSDGFSIMIFVGTATGGNTSLVRGLILIDNGPCSGQSGLVNLSRP